MSADAKNPPPSGALTDDRALVRALVAGDKRAFDEFAGAYIPALYRFAASRVRGDGDLAGEIVQTALLKVMARLGSYRGEATLMTWLCAFCKTEIAAHFRRSRRRPAEVEWTDAQAALEGPTVAPRDSPEESLLRGDAARMVHAALDRIPPHHGQVLEWKYLDNLSVKEIADRMSLTAKAAESLLTRARSSFREVYVRLQSGPSHEPE